MLTLKLQNLLNKINKQFLLSNIKRNFTETLEPVELSYATYESTAQIDTKNEAPPLVIMHGLLGSKSNWNSLCKAYQLKTEPRRKIIAADARNHGDSPHSENHTYAHMTEDLRSLMKSLNINKVALMGHSMGGRLVMLFALKYPELVEKVIVADISPATISTSFNSMLDIFVALENVELPKNVSMSHARSTVDEQLSKFIPDKSLRAFLLTNLVNIDDRYIWRINVPVLVNSYNNLGKFPSLGTTMIYDGPVLFIGGGNSDFIPSHLNKKFQIVFKRLLFKRSVELSYNIFENEQEAPPVLILHGLLGKKLNFQQYARKLQQQVSPKRLIISLDARNHGESPHTKSHTYEEMSEDLMEFLKKFRFKEVALLGHSMGGRTSMWFALSFPELVERMIIVDISPVYSSANLKGVIKILRLLNSIKLPEPDKQFHEAVHEIDEQLKIIIHNEGLRQFLISNLHIVDKKYKWRINLPVLLAAFESVHVFPDYGVKTYNGPVLFIAGGESDFIPIVMLSYHPFPKYHKQILQQTLRLISIKSPHKNISEETNSYPVSLSYASYESTKSSSENEAPPFLILHGFLGSKNNWNSLCKMYHQKCLPERKIFAVDARNHGESPHSPYNTYEHLVLDIKNFLEEMKVKRVCLMGHSMGGRASMLFALKYPDIVDKLIVVDISPISTSVSFKTMPQLLYALRHLRLPSNVPFSVARSSVRKLLYTFINNKPLVTFLMTNLINLSDGRYGWRLNIPNLLKNFSYIGSFPDLHNVGYEGPSLFIGGTKSDFIQKSDFPKIKKLFPNAELKYVDGAGHWLHAEKPTEFLNITLEFLNNNIKK